MKVLQNGLPKSGNYWLYSILSQILDKAEIPKKSFIQSNPIYELSKTWLHSHPDQAGMDVLDIENRKQFMRVSSYYKYPISDIDEYIENNRLVWTHSRFIPDNAEIYEKFDKVVYIIRDPRDVAISMAHFAFTPYRLNAHHNPYENVEAYLEDNFVKHITGWCQHVGSHLMSGALDNVHVVFYEDLKQNFTAELGRLLDYLELDLSDFDKEEIQKLTSVSHMSKKSKGHVRKGKPGGWQVTLARKHIKQCNLIAGPLMKSLGYSKSVTSESKPSLPVDIPKRTVRNSMQRSIIARGLWMLNTNKKNIVRPDTASLGNDVK